MDGAEPSSGRVLLLALGFGVVIFLVSAGIDLYLLKDGFPARNMMFASDALAALIAFVLFLAYLRAARARNRYLRERLETVAGLNHNVRNALAVISLSNYLARSSEFSIIRDGVDRIERALDEFVPIEMPPGFQAIRESPGQRASDRTEREE